MTRNQGKKLGTPQPSIFEQIVSVASFGSMNETPGINRTNSLVSTCSSLEQLQANVKNLSKKAAEKNAATSKTNRTRRSRSPFSMSDLHASDQFRALSPLGTPLELRQPAQRWIWTTVPLLAIAP
jgi:hypothetical protein